MREWLRRKVSGEGAKSVNKRTYFLLAYSLNIGQPVKQSTSMNNYQAKLSELGWVLSNANPVGNHFGATNDPQYGWVNLHKT